MSTVKKIGYSLLSIVMVYGILAVLVFWYLPMRIARAEKLERGFREIAAEVRADERNYLECLKRSGLLEVKKDDERRREDYRNLLRDPVFVSLSGKYLGKASVADNVKTSNQLRDAVLHQKSVKDAEHHKKSLLSDLRGPNGSGSVAWHVKLHDVEMRLAKLEQGKLSAEGSAKEAQSVSKGKVLALRNALVNRSADLDERLQEAEKFRLWRSRLCIWPLTFFEKEG